MDHDRFFPVPQPLVRKSPAPLALILSIADMSA
jgi:hypothetical protein